MWQCPKCSRYFEKEGQVHSCRKKPLAEHFKDKKLAQEVFDFLVEKIKKDIGPVEIVSIPCCIHLYGRYDFLAALPRKDHLEIRFSLPETLKSPRLKQAVAVSAQYYKNCIDLESTRDVDAELIAWINRAYHLKENANG